MKYSFEEAFYIYVIKSIKHIRIQLRESILEEHTTKNTTSKEHSRRAYCKEYNFEKAFYTYAITLQQKN